MRALAEFKRALKPGLKLMMIHHQANLGKDGEGRVILGTAAPVERIVKKVQTNAVCFGKPPVNADTWLYFDKASLTDVEGNRIKIYETGERSLTTEEVVCIAGEPKDARQDEIDALSDGNQMFYRRKRYYEERGMGYLYIRENGKGRSQRNDGMVEDPKVKGKLLLEYEIIG